MILVTNLKKGMKIYGLAVMDGSGLRKYTQGKVLGDPKFPADDRPIIAVIEFGIYGDPVVHDGKLVMGLGSPEGGVAPEEPARIPIVDDMIHHYFITREEAEEIKEMSEYALNAGFSAGIREGQIRTSYANIFRLKKGTTLFFLEVLPGGIPVPVALLGEVHGQNDKIVIGKWQLMRDPDVFANGTKVTLSVRDPREPDGALGPIIRDFTLPVEDQELVHFYMNEGILRDHLRSANMLLLNPRVREMLENQYGPG